MTYYDPEHYKEVRFDKYCNQCKHRKLQGNEEPCSLCLAEPVNYETEKPVKFELDEISKESRDVRSGNKRRISKTRKAE